MVHEDSARCRARPSRVGPERTIARGRHTEAPKNMRMCGLVSVYIRTQSSMKVENVHYTGLTNASKLDRHIDLICSYKDSRDSRMSWLHLIARLASCTKSICAGTRLISSTSARSKHVRLTGIANSLEIFILLKICSCPFDQHRHSSSSCLPYCPSHPAGLLSSHTVAPFLHYAS